MAAVPLALPVRAPTNVVAVTVLSFSRTESIVTPAAAVVSSIVSVVIFWLADTMMFVEPVVFPAASTSASVSKEPTWASTYVLTAPWVANNVELEPRAPLSIPVTVAPVAKAKLVDPEMVVNEAAPPVIELLPLLMLPNPDAIEPELRAPTVTRPVAVVTLF